MPLLFLLVWIVTVAGLGMIGLSIIVGAVLCFRTGFRRVGVFLLLIPSLSWAFAVVFSSGATLLLLSSYSTAAGHGESWASLAWPVAFLVGGATGAASGAAIAVLITRRMGLPATVEVSTQPN